MFPGRRNVLLMAFSQALMITVIVMSVTLGAILGGILAPDKGLATLPIAMMVIGTAIASLPAALLMRHFGRRAGFFLGAVLGVSGSLLCALALHERSFILFVTGHLLLGSYQGFANYYRFAAVEATDFSHASRAISWVVAGGVVAAFLGPQLGVWGRDWIVGELFVGSYLAQAALSLIALALISRVHINPVMTTLSGAARPLRQILLQPALHVAVFGSAVGYAVMVMVMTATPLAILGCGLPGSDVTPVIQWHVLGMFAPSFFAGWLIRRHGAVRIMQTGFLLLLGHVAIAVSGVKFLHFFSALVLLGIGWNFVFIGGTTLLTQTYRPSEQLRVQAINEFAIFGLVALSTLSAGWLYDQFGWITLNLAVVPLLGAALLATTVIGLQLRAQESPI